MKKDPLMAIMTGPLASYVPGYVAALQGDGYRPESVQGHVELLAHMSRWLEAHNLELINFTSALVDEYLQARRGDDYARLITGKGVAPLLSHLRAAGAIPGAQIVRRSANANILADYSEYLIKERSLARSTARDYAFVARRFVDDYPVARLGDLNAERVLRFVSDECRHYVPGPVVTGLRAFLRYCFLRGLTKVNFANAIPAVANVGRSSIAKDVAPNDVLRLLENCDRTTAAGLRNFAILSVLARLGLRAKEVAAMELSDIDWRRGELTVRGKGPRLDALPLPVDVGEALAAWLATGRPPCAHRYVFCRLLAPLDRLTSTGVSAVVTATCRRVQIPEFGAHALRHSAARHLLRSGSNLSDIAQVLRHEDVATTSIYAKADHATLVRAAQPWPGTSTFASLVSAS